MYVKSIILEGFKSYAQRTEVNGFDPLFNAITGLNGSGKSNILDSICFLLGISNLSQVKCKLAGFCKVWLGHLCYSLETIEFFLFACLDFMGIMVYHSAAI